MYGLYIHIPFCLKKCRYCDFISFVNQEVKIDKYLTSLEHEMKEYQNLKVDSIFIGGGTPTVLSSSQLERLINMIRNNFDITSDAEFSIESNPKTLTKDKLQVLKNGGVNRISIGVQSFDDDELEFLGRVHSSRDAEETIKLSHKYVDNINIDLMFAVPGQTMMSVEKSLKKAIELNPSHISCYSLILEEGTDLYHDFELGKISTVDDETDRMIFDKIKNILKNAGYERYEISNFAQKGAECIHNLKYWNFFEYIGIGVAAHSYINGKRSFNTSDIDEYISGNMHEEKTELTDSDKMSEYMIMGLRKIKGIEISDFVKRFQKNIYDVFDIKKFEAMGLLINNGKRIYLSEQGLDVSNSILCEFV